MKKTLLVCALGLFAVSTVSAQTGKRTARKKAPAVVKTVATPAPVQAGSDQTEEEKKLTDRRRNLQNRKVVTTPASESLVPGN